MEGGQYAVKKMQLINDLFFSMTVLYHVNDKLKRAYGHINYPTLGFTENRIMNLQQDCRIINYSNEF